MGRPYSNNLRERVVGAVEQGGMSRHQAAAHFGVAISTAINWVKRFRQTASVAPGQMGGHKPRAISGAHRDWLHQAGMPRSLPGFATLESGSIPAANASSRHLASRGSALQACVVILPFSFSARSPAAGFSCLSLDLANH